MHPGNDELATFSSRTKLAVRAVVVCFSQLKNAMEVLGGYKCLEPTEFGMD